MKRLIQLALIVCINSQIAPAQDGAALKLARYPDCHPAVPVYVVPGQRMLHRFFDTSPISPSGRYLALFRLPYENRAPAPGDAGDIVLVDLKTGQQRHQAAMLRPLAA